MSRHKQRGFLGFLGGLATSVIGSLVGGKISQKGQEEANETNRQIAQENRDFQERMSNTSYQRAVGDLQSAGLNPMLAYGQGGASTPAGATAVMQNTDAELGNSARDALTRGLAAENVKKQNELLDAQIEKTGADAFAARAQGWKTNAEIDAVAASIGKTKADTDLSQHSAVNVDATTRKVTAETGRIVHEIDQLKANTKAIGAREELDRARTILTRAETLYKSNQIGMQEYMAIQMRAQAIISNNAIPASDAEKEKSETWWGQNISPYIRDALGVGNSARAIRGATHHD